MDNKWRTISCGCDGGIEWRLTLGGYYDYTCSGCKGSGTIYLRPSGHAFSYPGGPAVGSYTSVAYETAEPVESWDDEIAREKRVQDFILPDDLVWNELLYELSKTISECHIKEMIAAIDRAIFETQGKTDSG